MDGRRIFAGQISGEKSISLMKNIRAGSGYHSPGITFVGEEVIQWYLVVPTNGYHIVTAGSFT